MIRRLALFATIMLWVLASGVPLIAPMPSGWPCARLSPADTLILDGQRQRASRFIECVTGRWPDVRSKFRKVKR